MDLVCLTIAGALYARVEADRFSLRLPQPGDVVIERFYTMTPDGPVAAEADPPVAAPVVVPHPRGGPHAAICAPVGPCVSLERMIPPRRSSVPVIIDACPDDPAG